MADILSVQHGCLPSALILFARNSADEIKSLLSSKTASFASCRFSSSASIGGANVPNPSVWKGVGLAGDKRFDGEMNF